MRVLFIPSWFPSKGNPYAGNFIKRLAIDLSSHGIQIVILHFDYSYKQLSIKKKATETINENLTIHHFSGFQIPKINNITQNNWIQSCISESESLLKNWNFDYIHSHDYVASFLGDELAKKKNIKHIISLHHSNFIENKIQTWRVELLKNVFKNAYKVITPSTKFTQKINLGFKINAHTIPHYIYWDLKIKKAFNEELRAISVTSFEAVKNNKELLEFCAKNKIKLDIFGGIEKALSKNIPEGISYKGKLPFNDLQKIYCEYDFLISYSSVETFGLTVLEALSHGLPVLVKNEIGGYDLVTNENGKFINSSFIYNDFIDKLRNYNSLEISHQINIKFSKESAIEKYKEIYAN